MDFAQLRQFIDDSLEQLSAGNLNNDCPHSKEEFLALLELLQRKIGHLEDNQTGHALEFEPSPKLKSLVAQRKQLRVKLRAKLLSTFGRKKTKGTKNSIKKLKERLQSLEQEISALGKFEMWSFEKHRDNCLRSNTQANVAPKTAFLDSYGTDVGRSTGEFTRILSVSLSLDPHPPFA